MHFGDYDRALDELKRAIDLNGSDAESYSDLVSVLLCEGDIAGAIAAGRLLAQFEPELPDGVAFILPLLTYWRIRARTPSASWSRQSIAIGRS